MRFQNLENSKIYKIYRNDQMSRLKKKIEEIKSRKNQHSQSIESHTLPYISPGFGFTTERKHQIQKQNQRLNSKIKKAKNTHSSYYIKPSIMIKNALYKNSYTQNQSLTQKKSIKYYKIERQNIRSIFSFIRTDRSKSKKNNEKQQRSEIAKSFPEQVLNLYKASRKQGKAIKIL